MSSNGHGYTVHFIAVIKNGDGNVRHQRIGKSFELRPGKVAHAFDAAAKSAEESIVDFWCKSDVPAGHD